MSVTTVRLQPEVESGLEAAAGRLQRSKGWVIYQALREFLARQEQEQTRWQETLEAIDSVARGRAIPGEAVHNWLRTWGTENESAPPKPGT